MKFRTAYDHDDGRSYAAPSGTGWKCKYLRSGRELVEDGKENIYDFIQKAANGTDVKALLARAGVGDSSALGNPDIASYADISKAPTSLLDASNQVIRARELFDSLPADTKALYKQDFSVFLEACDNGAFFKSELDKVNAKKQALIRAKKEAKKTRFEDLTPEETEVLRKKLNIGGNQ